MKKQMCQEVTKIFLILNDLYLSMKNRFEEDETEEVVAVVLEFSLTVDVDLHEFVLVVVRSLLLDHQ